MESFVTKAYGATGTPLIGKSLTPMEVERRKPSAREVLVEVLYCGVCHSDIHQAENDWMNTIYPCVPGHEIIGKVASVGKEVSKFKLGDTVGVGCMIDSCKTCAACEQGEEQFCLGPVGCTLTYNGYFNPKDKEFNTYGGFSTHVVVSQDFVLNIPGELDLSRAAPILCAGITTYSPLKHWNVKSGDRVGVIGIGGLGHMAVMIAKAMGAHVTAITTSEEKRNSALDLGADDVLVSEDEEAMKGKEIFFDFILCTIPEKFDVNPYIKLLKYRGNLITVGLLGPYEKATDNMEVAKLGRSVGGSLIGGILETQECLNFCARNNIQPHVEMLKIENINDAFERVKNEEILFRYVIDMKSL